MFPWEVLITGAVGVGGTALGAWLNGRMQTKNLRLSLDAESERARLAEKRRIYAAFLAASNELIVGVGDFRASVREENTGRLEADYNRMAEARTLSLSNITELELIASPDIGAQARSLRRFLVNFAFSRTSNMAEEASQNPDPIIGMRARLLDAMRADLGEPD
jgi:hypothetical protein